MVKAVTKPKKQIMYPELDIRVFSSKKQPGWEGCTPMTAEIAKELLGWKVQKDGEDWKEFLTYDKTGRKIRCSNNANNRPFYEQLAEDWMLEILRNEWSLTGETIIIDKLGAVKDGQHRLFGLVWANEIWELDSKKPVPEQKWQEHWKSPPTIDCIVVLGIDESEDVANKMNTGRRRNETDALYRSAWLSGMSQAKRKDMAKSLGHAVKYLWHRTEQSSHSMAPRRPHSELFKFIEAHNKLVTCVEFILTKSRGDKLKQFIQPGYASCLLYLMAAAASLPEMYAEHYSEKGIDFKFWEQAQMFWTDLIDNGPITEPLREVLIDIPVEATGAYNRDMRCGLIIKAWNMYIDTGEITSDLHLAATPNSFGQPVISETPKIGGIDT
jgi:hypothetical protein